MHPPLHRPHPSCQHVIDALIACHDNHPYAKFWGACNDEKCALDKCFRIEKEERRRANFTQAKSQDKAWARYIAQKEKEEAAATGGPSSAAGASSPGGDKDQ